MRCLDLRPKLLGIARQKPQQRRIKTQEEFHQQKPNLLQLPIPNPPFLCLLHLLLVPSQALLRCLPLRRQYPAILEDPSAQENRQSPAFAC